MPEGKLEKVVDKLITNFASKTLLDCLPFVGPVFKNTYDRIRQKRLRVFRDELRHTGILDDHMVDDDLVHAACCTIEAVIRTREEDKIRCFAKILSSAYEDTHFRQSGPVERCIQIITELSPEEMIILITINRANEEMRERFKSGYRRNSWIEDTWQVVERMLRETLGINDKQEALSKLIRLQRTGCVQLHPGFDGGYAGVSLLPVYHDIKSFLISQNVE